MRAPSSQKPRHHFLKNGCSQANYILVLLGETYGFARDGRTVTFALDVEGEDLEWPLGALLHQRAQQESTGTAFKPARKEL